MISIKDHQEWVKDAWTKSPKSRVSERDELLFLMKEVGEMTKAVRKLSGDKKDMVLKADLEKAFEKTKKSIIMRFIKKIK